MTIKQAIKIVEKHNKWRRGGRGKMANPKELGKALDVLILVAQSYTKLYNLDKVKVTVKDGE